MCGNMVVAFFVMFVCIFSNKCSFTTIVVGARQRWLWCKALSSHGVRGPCGQNWSKLKGEAHRDFIHQKWAERLSKMRDREFSVTGSWEFFPSGQTSSRGSSFGYFRVNVADFRKSRILWSTNDRSWVHLRLIRGIFSRSWERLILNWPTSKVRWQFLARFFLRIPECLGVIWNP